MLLNRKIKRFFKNLPNGACILAGDRGVGKSSILALVGEVYQSMGYKVFCQYPYKGFFQIPMKVISINGLPRSVVDKEWLYNSDLRDCCVLLDEGKNIWPARSYSHWTQSDDDFFDMLRKNNTFVAIASLAYDCMDLNVRRSVDFTFYMTKSFLHFTYCEVAHTTIAKVADSQKEILGRAGRQGMRKVNYEICELPFGNMRFWRKPYYNKFLTEYIVDVRPAAQLISWPDDLFEKKK